MIRKKKKVQCYRSVTKHHVNTAFIRLEIHFERLTNLLSNVYRSSLSSLLLPVLHFFLIFFELVFYLPQHSLSSLISPTPPSPPFLFLSSFFLPCVLPLWLPAIFCPPSLICLLSPSSLFLALLSFSLHAHPSVSQTAHLLYIYIYLHKHLD